MWWPLRTCAPGKRCYELQIQEIKHREWTPRNPVSREVQKLEEGEEIHESLYLVSRGMRNECQGLGTL